MLLQVTKDVILQQAIQAFRADFQSAMQRTQVSAGSGQPVTSNAQHCCRMLLKHCPLGSNQVCKSCYCAWCTWPWLSCRRLCQQQIDKQQGDSSCHCSSDVFTSTCMSADFGWRRALHCGVYTSLANPSDMLPPSRPPPPHTHTQTCNRK